MYGQYEEVGFYQGETERPTIPVIGRYSLNTLSKLLEIGRNNLEADVQVHFGTCGVPSNFDYGYTKVLVAEAVREVNWSADEMGDFSDADQAEVTETGEFSAKWLYEIVPLRPARKADTLITNEILAVHLWDHVACEEDACLPVQKWFAVTKAEGGSVGTTADCIYSLDKGAAFGASDIDGLGLNDPSDIDHLGEYLVVPSNGAAGHCYLAVSEIDTGGGETWPLVTDGYVAGGEPNAIASSGNVAWIVGDTGYVYKLTDATLGPTAIDEGGTTTQDLNCVDMYSDNFVVAGGNNGIVMYTSNGQDFTVVNAPSADNVVSIAVKNKLEWFAGTDGGDIYATYDAGTTWELKVSGYTSIPAISICTDSEIFATATHSTGGRILKSISSGWSWVVVPTGTGSIPENDRLNDIDSYWRDPNLALAGGLAGDGSDGILIAAQPATT
jgi:photosystem II stability/assembly factor-like uncharacterized protein